MPGIGKKELFVAWSADGTSIYVASGYDVPLRVDRVELATGRRVPFREFAPADRVGVLSVFPSLGANPDHYAYGYTKRTSTIFAVKGAAR